MVLYKLFQTSVKTNGVEPPPTMIVDHLPPVPTYIYLILRVISGVLSLNRSDFITIIGLTLSNQIVFRIV